MISQLKQNLHTAHAAHGYALNTGIGVQAAINNLNTAIDEFYDHIQANQAQTLGNVSAENERGLNANF